MRALFISIGTKGDVYPFVGIALEMKRAGFSPVIMTAEPFRAEIEALGIEFKSIMSADLYRWVMNHEDLWTSSKSVPLMLEHIVTGTAPQIVREVEAQCALGPCLMVANNMSLGAKIAAEKFELEYFSVYLAPSNHTNLNAPRKKGSWFDHVRPYLSEGVAQKFVRSYLDRINVRLQPLNDLRESLGLERERDLVFEWRYRCANKINLWPDWFTASDVEDAAHCGFVNYEPRSNSESSKVPKGAVAFTLGSGMNQRLNEQISLFGEVCRRLGMPGVVISPLATGESQVAPYLWLSGPRSLGDLFDCSSAAVIHGGIGTVGRALRSGTPLLVTPMAFDQFDNGDCIKALGVGSSVPFKNLSPKKLTSRLGEMLDGNTQSRAHAVKAKMSSEEDGAHRAASFITARLRQRNSPASSLNFHGRAQALQSIPENSYLRLRGDKM